MYKQYTIHTVSTYTDMAFFGEVQFKKEDFSTKKWGSIQEECSKIGLFTFFQGLYSRVGLYTSGYGKYNFRYDLYIARVSQNNKDICLGYIISSSSSKSIIYAMTNFSNHNINNNSRSLTDRAIFGTSKFLLAPEFRHLMGLENV